MYHCVVGLLPTAFSFFFWGGVRRRPDVNHEIPTKTHGVREPQQFEHLRLAFNATNVWLQQRPAKMRHLGV